MRLRDSVLQIVTSGFPRLFYRGVFEFRVVSVNGDKYELDPVSEKWLPPIKLTDQWPGVGGTKIKAKAGTVVAVAFLDANPGKPIVVGFPSAGDVPEKIEIDADEIILGDGTGETLSNVSEAVGRVVRYGDKILFPTPGPGPIALDVSGLSDVSKVKA